MVCECCGVNEANNNNSFGVCDVCAAEIADGFAELDAAKDAAEAAADMAAMDAAMDAAAA